MFDNLSMLAEGLTYSPRQQRGLAHVTSIEASQLSTSFEDNSHDGLVCMICSSETTPTRFTMFTLMFDWCALIALLFHVNPGLIHPWLINRLCPRFEWGFRPLLEGTPPQKGGTGL